MNEIEKIINKLNEQKEFCYDSLKNKLEEKNIEYQEITNTLILMDDCTEKIIKYEPKNSCYFKNMMKITSIESEKIPKALNLSEFN